ncbi:hypothetical protein [Acinetobacter courvalinii]|uniref:hypothetical protein n=1 Tax=Acinetobacter courvalinii TaxID=280147 RepID=UPI00289E2813|nr:hypothetical protein [Acinetobacter courvalinii]
MTAAEKTVLDRNIKEIRDRAIHFDHVKRLFKSVLLEEPKQWRSIPNIIETITPAALTKLVTISTELLEKHRLFNDKLVIIFENQTVDFLKKIQQALDDDFKQKSISLGFGYQKYEISTLDKEKEPARIFRFIKERNVYSKEEINVEALDQTTQSKLSEYDQILGVRSAEINCYDALIIDHKQSFLILQIDLVSLIRSSELDKDIEAFIKMLNTILERKFGKGFRIAPKNTAINLYKCIQNFYNKDEGFVTKLSFTTSKGVHHETLKGAATDIRKADYHIGGKANESGKISAYRITKKFEIDPNNKPQAYIGVRFQYFNKPGNKYLGNARIFDVLSYSSYAFIIKKLLENR